MKTSQENHNRLIALLDNNNSLELALFKESNKKYGLDCSTKFIYDAAVNALEKEGCLSMAKIFHYFYNIGVVIGFTMEDIFSEENMKNFIKDLEFDKNSDWTLFGVKNNHYVRAIKNIESKNLKTAFVYDYPLSVKRELISVSNNVKKVRVLYKVTCDKVCKISDNVFTIDSIESKAKYFSKIENSVAQEDCPF